MKQRSAAKNIQPMVCPNYFIPSERGGGIRICCFLFGVFMLQSFIIWSGVDVDDAFMKRFDDDYTKKDLEAVQTCKVTVMYQKDREVGAIAWRLSRFYRR